MMKEDFIATTDRLQLDPQDLNAIDQLARKTRQPTEKIKRIYADVISRLRSGARIQRFLTLLTSKKVRDILRKTETRQA
jgi:CII-binding regulator of phage lambda lysogenization HflD